MDAGEQQTFFPSGESSGWRRPYQFVLPNALTPQSSGQSGRLSPASMISDVE